MKPKSIQGLAIRVAIVVAPFLAIGCASIDAPDGYVRLRRPAPYDFKAVSARGAAFALSSHANEDSTANLAFWSAAVEHEKVDIDGMTLASRESIRTNGGLEGTLFRFETGDGDGRQVYLVAIYVTPQKIHTVEAAGSAASVDADMDKLKKAIASLRQ